MIKGFQIRLYPTQKQEELIWKHIHACRFIWNYMIDVQQENYNVGKKYLTAFDMMKLLTPLKKQEGYIWLNDIANSSLQMVCRDLDLAYKSFFRKEKRFPKYKSKKRQKASYPLRNDTLTFINQKTIKIHKLGKIKIKDNRSFEKVYNPRISYVNNKWILSFGMDCENQAVKTTDIPMGIDLGIKEFAVVSFGDQKLVFHNINKSKRIRTLEHKLKYIQKIRDRKYRTHKNYEKSKSIQKYEAIEKALEYKLANIRKNYIQHVVSDLIKLFPRKVVVEDLDVTLLMKNKYQAKAISKQNFYMFRRQMKNKCLWYGIQFIEADRFFPSSKMCSCCGSVKKKLDLDERVFSCNNCGLTIDRDYNAAINLMRYVPQVER